MLQIDNLKKHMHEAANAFAEILIQEYLQEDKLLPKQARKKKIALEIDDHVNNIANKISNGLKVIIESLSEIPDASVHPQQVIDEFQKCLYSIKDFKDVSKIGSSLLAEISLKTSLGISNQTMIALYEGAKHIFDKKDYIHAEQAFFVLCTLDPKHFAFWTGLGHSCFHNKHYDQAINAYAMASALDPTNVWPHIWAANSFEKENDFQSAKMALQAALNLQKEIVPKNDKLLHSLEERIRRN